MTMKIPTKNIKHCTHEDATRVRVSPDLWMVVCKDCGVEFVEGGKDAENAND